MDDVPMALMTCAVCGCLITDERGVCVTASVVVGLGRAKCKKCASPAIALDLAEHAAVLSKAWAQARERIAQIHGARLGSFELIEAVGDDGTREAWIAPAGERTKGPRLPYARMSRTTEFTWSVEVFEEGPPFDQTTEWGP